MKKNILIALFLLVGQINYSQEIERILAKETCDCISKKKNVTLKTVTENCLTGDVFVKILFQEYEKGIIKSEIDSIMKSGNGHDFAYMLGKKVANELLIYCPSYYNLFFIERENSIKKIKNNFSLKELDSINAKESILLDFLFDRGKKNFAYGNYDLAIKDFEKMINYYPDFSGSYYFLAWIYEKKKDFVRSLKFYDKVGEYIFDVNISLINRLLKERVKNKEKYD